MNVLFLLRHAEALTADPGEPDHARRLSEHGCAQARAVGQWLAAHEPQPTGILCSTSRRTRMTAQLVLAALAPHAPAVSYVADIYDATPGQLLAVLENHADATHTLLVGHNPGISHLLALLCQPQAQPVPPMRPATLACLGMGTRIEPGQGRLTSVFHP